MACKSNAPESEFLMLSLSKHESVSLSAQFSLAAHAAARRAQKQDAGTG